MRQGSCVDKSAGYCYAFSGVLKRGLVGCVDQLSLEGVRVNLNDGPRAAMGTEPGCPKRPIRVVGFGQVDQSTGDIVQSGSARFADQQLQADAELSLRFKTHRSSGLLAYIADQAKVGF